MARAIIETSRDPDLGPQTLYHNTATDGPLKRRWASVWPPEVGEWTGEAYHDRHRLSCYEGAQCLSARVVESLDEAESLARQWVKDGTR